MITFEPHAEGIAFQVKAHAGARENCITGEHNGALKVAVTQAAERGKANKAIIEVLAQQLDVSKSRIEILRGETSTQKHVLIRAVAEPELAAKIAAALAGRRAKR
jgi:uncharacterized protein (TIGR00251 family)